MMSSNSRRQSREIALQVLFQSEFFATKDPEKNFAAFQESFSASRDTLTYAKELTLGIFGKLEEIDQKIDALSSHWSTQRMPLVDLNILRVATYEIRFSSEVPHRVAINEAVEVAKKYGGSESAAFVNGLLDSMIKE